MSVEIHQPEIEALIQQRMASGAFQDVEEVLLYALKSAPPTATSVRKQLRRQGTLEEMFSKARGLLTDSEVDTLFLRDASPGRSIDLS